jgi:hypothetical protein
MPSVKDKFPVLVLNVLVLQCMFADDLLADTLIVLLLILSTLEEVLMFVEQIENTSGMLAGFEYYLEK